MITPYNATVITDHPGEMVWLHKRMSLRSPVVGSVASGEIVTVIGEPFIDVVFITTPTIPAAWIQTRYLDPRPTGELSRV